MPKQKIKLDNTHAKLVWKIMPFTIFFVLPSSFLIALIAAKHGALKRLNTTKAYAEIGEKKSKQLPILKHLIM